MRTASLFAVLAVLCSQAHAENAPVGSWTVSGKTPRGSYEGEATCSLRGGGLVLEHSRYGTLHAAAPATGEGSLLFRLTVAQGLKQGLPGQSTPAQPQGTPTLEATADERGWRTRLWVAGRMEAEESWTNKDPLGRTEGKALFLGVPFVEGRGEGRTVHPSDARQGKLGDCYLVAALVAVAKTDPHLIRTMISEEHRGRYTVRLRQVGDRGDDVGVIVDRSFPYVTQARERLPAFANVGDQAVVRGWTYYELWPAMIEKAYAQHRGGYKEIESGGHCATVFSFISGAPTETHEVVRLSPRHMAQRIATALQSGYPVCVGTRKEVGRLGAETDVVGLHAYVIWRLEGGGVRLYNPWGTKHPSRPITIRELHSIASYLYVGKF